MNEAFVKAKKALQDFKGDDYAFGRGALEKTGVFAASLGKRALLVANTSTWMEDILQGIKKELAAHGVALAGDRVVPGARANSPTEDIARIREAISAHRPDFLLLVGGGSTIDAGKAANILYGLDVDGDDLGPYFGVGQVSKALVEKGARLLPTLAVQTAASSGAHLTKYSNVTDLKTGQKKLIVDEAIIPEKAIFDYSLISSTPGEVKADGAFDGLAHCLEVYYGSGADRIAQIEEVALLGIELVIDYTERCIADPNDKDAETAIGLATDLGGYAIMLGGTNGAHLTSFSLVELSSHGRACAIMNPYYTVFFAPAIRRQLEKILPLLQKAGLAGKTKPEESRALGEAVAAGLMELAKRVNFPVTLAELDGFDDKYILQALQAAKNPQLEMKLQNMPVSLQSSQVDTYMAPILNAAKSGSFAEIKNYQE